MRRELFEKMVNFWDEHLGDFWTREVLLLFVFTTIALW